MELLKDWSYLDKPKKKKVKKTRASSRKLGTNPRATGNNPRAKETNPRAKGLSIREKRAEKQFYDESKRQESFLRNL